MNKLTHWFKLYWNAGVINSTFFSEISFLWVVVFTPDEVVVVSSMWQPFSKQIYTKLQQTRLKTCTYLCIWTSCTPSERKQLSTKSPLRFLCLLISLRCVICFIMAESPAQSHKMALALCCIGCVTWCNTERVPRTTGRLSRKWFRGQRHFLRILIGSILHGNPVAYSNSAKSWAPPLSVASKTEGGRQPSLLALSAADRHLGRADDSFCFVDRTKISLFNKRQLGTHSR